VGVTVPDDAHDSEPRQRPEYGEYASPEEQERAIARSLPPGSSASAEPPSPPVTTGPSVQNPLPPASRTTAGAGDRAATILLLSLGLLYLIGGAGGYLSLGTTLDTVYSQFGLGDYTPTASTTAFGIAILACQAIIWIASVVWSYRRLTHGRRSWWVPLLGALATFLVTVVLFGVLLAGDPAFVAYVSTA
jgi:hypothetical protein